MMTNNIFSLEGKSALITGASGCIGGAIANAFYKSGATVILNGRDLEKLEGAKSKILGTENSGFDNQIYTIPMNLMDIDSPAKLIKQSYDIVGKIDILVNAAGVYELKTFHKISESQLQNIMKINFIIPFELCQKFLSATDGKGFGRIINITSVSTHGAPSQAHYNSSKAALCGLTKSLASNPKFVENGITINSIAPGIIESNMSKMLRGTTKESLKNQIPMRRFGTSEEVAAAAVFLASPAASYINGQVIYVDGGMVR